MQETKNNSNAVTLMEEGMKAWKRVHMEAWGWVGAENLRSYSSSSSHTIWCCMPKVWYGATSFEMAGEEWSIDAFLNYGGPRTRLRGTLLFRISSVGKLTYCSHVNMTSVQEM